MPKQKSETGQTVRTPFYEIAEQDGKLYWVLWSGNGRMMAMSPVSYERRKDVVAAIKTLVPVIQGANLICLSHAK